MDPYEQEIFHIDANIEPYDIEYPNICLKNITEENYKKWFSYLHKPFLYLYLQGSITDLTLPDGPKNILCNNMNIQILNISDSVNALYCNNNEIKELYLTKNLRYVEACDNYLTLVKYKEYPNNLKSLLLENNSYVHIDIDQIPDQCFISYSTSANVPQHIENQINEYSFCQFYCNIQEVSESNV